MTLQLSTGHIYCRDISLLSRHQLRSLEVQLVAFGVATSVLCRDITLSYISLIFSTCHIFKALLLSRPPSLVATSIFVTTSRCCRDIITGLCQPQSATLVNQLLSFLPCHFLHFYSTNCCIFLLLFLLSLTLPANNKLVSFFIFLHINYSFLDKNQTEKWIKKI